MSIQIYKPNEDLKSYEIVFDQSVTVFHPYDKDYMDFLQIIYVKERNAKKYVKCLEIMRLILTNYYQHLPRYHLNIGLSEMLAGKFCIALNLLDEAKLCIRKAEKILRTTFGHDHPIVQNISHKFSKLLE